MSSIPSEYPSIDTLITQLKEINKEVQSSDLLADSQILKINEFLERNRDVFVLYIPNMDVSPLKGNLEQLEDKIRDKFKTDTKALVIANKINEIRMSMVEIPFELRTQSLSFEERKALSKVSDQEKIAYMNAEKLELREIIDWEKRTFITPKIWEIFKTHGRMITHLDLSGYDVSNDMMKQIVSYCPNLETLLIFNNRDKANNYPKEENEKLTHEGLKWIQNLKKLQTLEITNYNETQIFPEELYNLQSLQKLILNSFFPVPDGIKKLKNLKELSLKLHTHSDIPNKLPDDFGDLKNLEVLQVTEMDMPIELRLTEEQIKNLKIVKTNQPVRITDDLKEQLGNKLERGPRPYR